MVVPTGLGLDRPVRGGEVPRVLVHGVVWPWSDSCVWCCRQLGSRMGRPTTAPMSATKLATLSVRASARRAVESNPRNIWKP